MCAVTRGETDARFDSAQTARTAENVRSRCHRRAGMHDILQQLINHKLATILSVVSPVAKTRIGVNRVMRLLAT